MFNANRHLCIFFLEISTFGFSSYYPGGSNLITRVFIRERQENPREKMWWSGSVTGSLAPRGLRAKECGLPRKAVFLSALFAKQWPQTICIRITWNSYFKMNWDPPVDLHPWVWWAIQILFFKSTSPDFLGHLSCSHFSTESSLLICSLQYGPQLPVLFVPLRWWVKPAIGDHP